MHLQCNTKCFCLHTRIRWHRHSTGNKIQNTQDVSSKISILYFPPSMWICWCYFSKCHPCSVKTKTKKKVCCWDRYGLRVLTCSFLSPWLRMLFMSLCSRCKPPYRDHTLGLLVDKRPSTVVFRLDSSFQCSFLEGNREARRHLTKREEVQRFWCWQCSWLIH